MITLTPNAAEKLGGILTEKGLAESHALRVFVKGGGCGGMQYGMTFDDQVRDGDQEWSSMDCACWWMRPACSTSTAPTSTTWTT